MMRLFFTATLVVAIAGVAHAGGQWTLTTADFHARPVALHGIDESGVHIASASGSNEEVVPFGQFLDLSRQTSPLQLGGRFALHLVSGDTLGGEPAGIKGNDLIWNSPIMGEVAIPMKQLIAMSHPGSPTSNTRRHEDVVTLANGDTLRGIISNFADGKVTVHADAANTDIPLASVNQINFAAATGTTPPTNGFRIRFDDGSSLVATSLNIVDGKLNVVLRKDESRSVDLTRVDMIEQVNGPVSWLSSRPTVESIYIPFFGPSQSNAAQMDRNWSGQEPIRFGTQEFAHGIGVHSYSRLTWDLDGSYATFHTRYAIDTKDANTQADVTVRILLDGKPVYEQAHVRAGALSPVVVENIAGAKKLTLEVDYGENMDTQDRVNWIEPALVKENTKP